MFIAKIDNGIATEYPISEKEFRKRVPNVSLPKQLTQEVLEPLGYAMVSTVSAKDFPTPTKDSRVILAEVYNDGGIWKRRYALEEITDPVVKSNRLLNKWREIREKRDSLIADAEWRISRYNRQIALGLQTTDNILELHQYIQNLADITTQPDPFLIVFPAPPNS